jgi:TIGR03009 family protein
MRTLGLTLSALMLTGLVAFGQSTGAPPAKDSPTSATKAMSEKNQKYLDAYLKVWEERMASVTSLETKVVVTETEDGQKTVYTGDASVLKPNYARLMLKEAANPTDHRKWRHIVADGEFLWEYHYGKKVAHVAQLPKEGIGDNTAMIFLFGTKAADIKKRFDLDIDVDDDARHNDFYLRINVLPKSKADMQEFKKAELVLFKNNKDEKFADVWMLPARLWFQHPNGNQVSWEFKNMTTKKKFLAKDFEAPRFPDKEWKSEWSKPPVPTVSRSSAPPK